MNETPVTAGGIGFEAQPSLTIVERIAEREGKDPVALPPLYYTIDPEAIDTLCRSPVAGRAQSQLSFTYCGYEVTAHSDGEIEIAEMQ